LNIDGFARVAVLDGPEPARSPVLLAFLSVIKASSKIWNSYVQEEMCRRDTSTKVLSQIENARAFNKLHSSFVIRQSSLAKVLLDLPDGAVFPAHGADIIF
jgi:hypothetical protein